MKIEKVVFNEKEAACYIGMSVSYLQHTRSDGSVGDRTPGPIYIKVGRTIRYLKSDLDEWLIGNRVTQEAL